MVRVRPAVDVVVLRVDQVKVVLRVDQVKVVLRVDRLNKVQEVLWVITLPQWAVGRA